MHKLRKYWEIAKSQIKLDMAYTTWFWANFAASLLQLLVLYYFWRAVYEHSPTVGGMSLRGMVSYVILANVLNQYVTGGGGSLTRDIRNGNVAIELMRPYNLLLKLIAMEVGYKISRFVREGVPVLLVAGLFMGIQLPASWAHAALFVLSAALGVLIGWQFDLMLSMVAFWTTNVWGIRVLRNGVLLFFTGSLVPVSLFPQWLRVLSSYMPFQSMVYVPVSIYTGALPLAEALRSLSLQAVWLVAMYLALQVIWRRAIRSITIFGG